MTIDKALKPQQDQTISVRCWKCHDFIRIPRDGGPCPHCGKHNIFNRAYQQSFTRKPETKE